MIWGWDKRKKAQKRIHFFFSSLGNKAIPPLLLRTAINYTTYIFTLSSQIGYLDFSLEPLFPWPNFYSGMLTFFLSFISFFFHSNKYILPLFFWLQLFIPILFSCRRLLFYILLLILKHFWPLSHIQANVRETHPLPTLKSICRHFGKKMTTPRQQIIKRENSMPRIKK